MRDRTTMFLLVVMVALAGLSWWQGGPGLALAGLVEGGQTPLNVIPLLVFAFLIAGLIQSLVSRQMVTRW